MRPPSDEFLRFWENREELLKWKAPAIMRFIREKRVTSVQEIADFLGGTYFDFLVADYVVRKEIKHSGKIMYDGACGGIVYIGMEGS